MKQRLTNNLGLKILSLLIAFFLWLLVVNVSNPEVTRTQEVTLEILNASVLEAVQKTYEVNRRTVSVAYDIHTMDEYKIRSSDFRAYIDLSELYDVTGSVAVKVEVLNNSGLIRNVAARPSVVRVATEDLQEKEFELTANIKGRPADGFSVNETVLTPSKITVKGPISQVGLINSVGVELDVSQADSDRSGTVVPVFYDANGNVMDPGDNIELNVGEVAYQVSVSKLKEVPVNYVVTGTPAEGFVYTGYETMSVMASLSGSETVLNSVTELNIADSSLDVSGLSEDKTVTVSLRDHLPEGLALAEHISPTAEVTLKIEALTTRTLTLPESEILLTGTDDQYVYRIQPTRIGVTLQGREEDLDGIGSSDLGVSVDVSGMSEGMNDCELVFETSSKYTVSEVESVQVEVSLRPAGPGDLAHAQPEASSGAEDETETESSADIPVAAEPEETAESRETGAETETSAAEQASESEGEP